MITKKKGKITLIIYLSSFMAYELYLWHMKNFKNQKIKGAHPKWNSWIRPCLDLVMVLSIFLLLESLFVIIMALSSSPIFLPMFFMQEW